MGTYFRRTNESYYKLGTSYLLTVPTTPVTRLVLNTAYVALQIANIGPSTIAYGDSSITASSGGLLFYSMDKTWDKVKSNFEVYLIADSVAGTVIVNGYKA